MLYIMLNAAIISYSRKLFCFLFTMPANPSSKIFATVPNKQYVESVFKVEFSNTENYRVPKKSVFSALIYALMIVLFDSFHFV
jgi:inorganic pyrophosphatase/exopolyphosphatase